MYDQSRVKISQGPTSFTVYGKTFSFPPRGKPDHYTGRDEALREAKKYGVEVLGAMERQKGGAPLSRREEITGQLDNPPDVRPIGERIRGGDGKLMPQPTTDPDKNPWASRLEQLRRQTAHTPSDKAQIARRIEMIQRSSDEWESKRDAERVIERRNADESIQRMREHANYAHEYCRRDATASADEVRERKRLLDLANSDTSEPRDYWSASKAADDRWFKRLDSIAEQKKAAASEAKAESAEARDIAKESRAVDFASDIPPALEGNE